MKNYKKLNDAELNNVTGGGENMDISVPNVLNNYLQQYIEAKTTMEFAIRELQRYFCPDYEPEYITAYVQSHWPKT
jgi:bacteriocin-like protein